MACRLGPAAGDREDAFPHGPSQNQRELLDAEPVVGHLMTPEGVFAFLAEHR